ncbi:MAG TPA: CDP-glycerol glycerophosphotransferase family protein, partial [Blastocatellia bacterium]|nr:CDP-glycerol glycerophosphotransferase family protein [Blastocatellia bacterium]
RWKPLLNSSRHIVYDDPWPANGPVIGRTNVRDENIERLTSSLCYSDVQISVSSTMTIDGSIFDRPQIGPAYDDRPEGKLDQICYELYLREHYLPITNSGGLDLVRSRSAMINAVRDALNDPSRLAEGRKQLVREICTYTDGQCTSRVDSALRSFITNHQATFSNQLEQAAVV